MHLKTIKVRGFKSFPDALELTLEPGVAVVVGPNGSGKSNVADAVVWAAGSLTPSELRAEKPDDVLFAGGGDRSAADHCEVELVFANEDAEWPELDFSEVSIKRRLVRGGEGHYLVNGASVRRTDLVELLADVGLGGAMHSIVGQGKVEAVLASRPEDRRALVEEAAGLGKFKRRKHRAELRLARVSQQVERARDVEAEVRKRLRPLALQATAAERAEKLAVEVAGLRARIAELDLQDLGEHRSAVEDRRDAAGLARRSAQARLEALLAERAHAEDELSDAAGRREAALDARYRLQGATERLGVRVESVDELLARLRAELGTAAEQPAPRGDTGTSPSPAELERLATESLAEARRAARERDVMVDRARSTRERLEALERMLAEREGLPPAARDLAENGESLVLDLLDVEPGSERAVAAALGPRASAVLARDAESGLELLRRAHAAGLGSLTVLAGRDPRAIVDEVPVVSLETLLEARVPSVTAEGFGFDPLQGELWYAGLTAEAVLLELEGRRRALRLEADELESRAEHAAQAADAAGATAREAESAYAAVAGLGAHGARAGVGRDALVRLVSIADRLSGSLAAALGAAGRFEAPLRARVDAGAARSTNAGEELRRLGGAEVEVRRLLDETGERTTEIEVELARLDAAAAEATRRLEEAGDVEPADGDARDELSARVERLDARRQALGQVNPLAREEYDEEKERLDDLSTQRKDLELSLEELERLRADLAETVERRFTETFASVSAHFEEVASTLFPGGDGRLRLVEPDDEESEHGIEVELRPAGKRITRLSLLSGGEKALGAISFLFALFLARPCPFYLLDEVEAALDDTNIARFVELLRRYADHAQFVVITHQKRTMEAADVLYGVTMGSDGISQIVSRRLPQPQHERELASA